MLKGGPWTWFWYKLILHHRQLADGEQWVAHRPIRTEPESTARCVPRAPPGAVRTIDWARWGQLSARTAGAVQMARSNSKNREGILVHRSLTLLFAPRWAGGFIQWLSLTLLFFFFLGPAVEVIRMTNSTHGGNVGRRQCQTSTD